MTFLNSCNTSIQLSVEPQFRGRVLALYLAVLQGGTAVGAPLMGWIGTEFGARWSVAAGGSIVLLTGLCSVTVVSRSSTLTLREQLRTVSVRKRPGYGRTRRREAARQIGGV
jgi:predicted MFS family arabinose efflux permease